MLLTNGNISHDPVGFFLSIFCCFIALVELFALINLVIRRGTAKVNVELSGGGLSSQVHSQVGFFSYVLSPLLLVLLVQLPNPKT